MLHAVVEAVVGIAWGVLVLTWLLLVGRQLQQLLGVPQGGRDSPAAIVVYGLFLIATAWLCSLTPAVIAFTAG